MKNTLERDESQFVLERYAEREALRRVRGASFSHCLTRNQVAEQLEIVRPDGQAATVHGKDIASHKTWERFLAAQTPAVELERLTFAAGSLAARYATWLRTQYTPRYRQLVREEEQTWLKHVALLAVLWHFLEHKHEMHTFVDPWAEAEMSKLLAAREASREMAKAVHHGVKEQAFTVLAQTYETYLQWVETRPFIPYEPLTVLPPGTPDPLALPAEQEEDDHE